jgi:hemolysin-activating ACP:hemolysin acyltransferase
LPTTRENKNPPIEIKDSSPSICDLNTVITGLPQTGLCKDETQQEIGRLVEICAKDTMRKNINIASFLHWIKPAVLHRQVLLLQREGDASANGYISWAWVNDETLAEYHSTPRFSLQPSEWNEGLNLIVVDFCALGSSEKIIRQLYKKTAALYKLGAQSINVCVRDATGVPVKNIKVKSNHD